MHPEFWNGKKVMVTGHTGFKGSWLSLWLQQLGAYVIGYSLPPPTCPNLFNIAQVENSDAMISVTGDVRDLDHLKSFVAEQEPEIVIHLAGQSLVRYSYENPIETYSTNVMGTVNILEAVRHSEDVRVVLVATSDKCYRNREWVWGYREHEPMGGYDPYSSSKSCAELVTEAYRESYWSKAENLRRPIAVASVRAGNVVGGGDWSRDRLVPDVLNAFMAYRPARIRHPTAVRSWQHVLEPLSGYLTLAEQLWEDGAMFAEAWNFGPDENDAKPVSWIVDNLATLWGASACWEVDMRSHTHEAGYLKLDSSKARTRLGWSPKLPLAVALEWIIEWYRCYQKEGDLRSITLTQILKYQNTMCI